VIAFEIELQTFFRYEIEFNLVKLVTVFSKPGGVLGSPMVYVMKVLC